MADQLSPQTPEEILAGMETVNVAINATLFYSLVQEILAKPSNLGLIEIGHAAWRNLTPIEQAYTLDGLFTAYIIRLIEESRDRQLTADATVTHLGPDDMPHLRDCLANAGPIGDDTHVEGVYADSLRNVLAEVDLLRQRLAQHESN